MPDGKILDVGKANPQRAELILTLAAVRAFLELPEFGIGPLRSLGLTLEAITDIERGQRHPMFEPASPQKGLGIRAAFNRSVAVAAAEILIRHKCCSPTEAMMWVQDESGRRGNRIDLATIDRHRRSFGGEYREAAKSTARHKAIIVPAKQHYETSLQFAEQFFGNCLTEGLDEADAAWCAAEFILNNRLSPPRDGKRSVKVQNILHDRDLRHITKTSK
jgi:hypothetical protein